MRTDAEAPVKEMQIEAVVIRADGSREDLGTVSYWHKNPLMRLLHRLRNPKHGNCTHNGR